MIPQRSKGFKAGESRTRDAAKKGALASVIARQHRRAASHLMSLKPFKHQSVVDQVPQLKRGQVWCYDCGYITTVPSASALKLGWPTHCGYTMSIDSPEERKALKAQPRYGGLRMRPLTEDEMRLKLRDLCDDESQKRVAKRFGVSPAFICDVLYGRRNVTEALATAMGYERVVIFRRPS